MACGSMLMKAEEVPAIVGQENPVLCHCERQNFHIRHGGVRISGIQRGQDVVSQQPQFHDNLLRSILVRVETGHSLSGLVVADLRLDFPGMRARIGPGIHQVLGAQMRVGGQQCLLARAKTPGLFEEPNGYPGSDQTRFTAANIRPRVDSWKTLVKILNHPLEKLRLLPTRQSRQ